MCMAVTNKGNASACCLACGIMLVKITYLIILEKTAILSDVFR